MQFITCINGGYIEFTRNFFRICKQNNIDFKVTVYCTDEEAFLACKGIENSNPVRFFNDSVSRLTVFGEKEFREFCQKRTECIKSAVSNSDFTSTCHIDMDIAVLKDFRKYVSDCMTANEGVDVFGQCDECAARCSNRVNCSSMCCGFMIFRHTKAVHELLDKVLQTIREKGSQFSSDQDVFNSCMTKINRFTFDKHIFPNGSFCGFYPDKKTYTKKTNISETAYLIHFNWLFSHQKQEAMRQWGFFEK
jgi:hypothetical protein